MADLVPGPLQVLDRFPAEALKGDTTDLHRHMDNLCLFHLRGINRAPLFVSTLLHGNETTGFYALAGLLRKIGDELPRDLIVLIGNVRAAQFAKRTLADQPDHNRIWNSGETRVHARADAILEYLRTQPLYAALDIHNCTGSNPAYVAITRRDETTLALAAHLSSRIVFFKEPHSTLLNALSGHCPSVTFESGLPGENRVRVEKMLRELLFSSQLPQFSSEQKEVKLFHSHARILVPPQSSFGFGNHEAHLNLDPKIDRFNFHRVEPGSAFGRYRDGRHLIVLDEANRDVSGVFFDYQHGSVVAKSSFVPSLLSTDPEVVRQDVLGYIMREEIISRETNET